MLQSAKVFDDANASEKHGEPERETGGLEVGLQQFSRGWLTSPGT